MLFQIDEQTRRSAKKPHEISMFNLMFFNLLMGAGMVVLGLTGARVMQTLGFWGFALPLVASVLVIVFIHLRAARAVEHDPWFVGLHWQLAKRRSRLLLIGYAITGVIISVGYLLASGADKNMQDIILTIATRIGAVPTLLMVMVSFVLESGSIYQAGRGEAPDGMVKRMPPPEGVVLDAESAG